MNIVTLHDKKYPKLLKKIGKTAPKQLYYKGNYNADIFENCLAVVGSRSLTTYGKLVAERLVTEIAAAGVTIVSGFMYGGDAAAHKSAVRAGGRTIAVMPCGIERIHPEYQQDLYHDILNNNGLVISEYENDQMPVNWMYPRRNRIVAGLSKAILVLEAGLKSGTLITANFAKKYGRKIFVVPGPITSENTKGIMQLIKDGAEAVSSAQDILRFYRSLSEFIERFTLKGSDATQKIPMARLENLEQQIADQLKRESLDIDDLSRIFGVSATNLGAALSLMELKGVIKQDGGKWQSNLI